MLPKRRLCHSRRATRTLCGTRAGLSRLVDCACAELGIEDHVVFFNQFVDQAKLLDFISMCDVHVTPYLNEAR